jgi:Class III cytochrome C family
MALKGRALLIAISICLCMLIGLVFAFPHRMVAPGPLMPAHAGITRNCFACHAPLRGVPINRCINCHKVSDIGIRTTLGVAMETAGKRPAFHQALAKPDCMACHAEHNRPRLVKTDQQRFAHSLLRSDARGQCATCHRAPSNDLHSQANNDCASCHGQSAWKPATFDHARHFELNGPHAVSCATCHDKGTFRRNTCFGCHEHQPGRMQAIHAEEGIRDISNCAACHRSGSGEGSDDD